MLNPVKIKSGRNTGREERGGGRQRGERLGEFYRKVIYISIKCNNVFKNHEPNYRIYIAYNLMGFVGAGEVLCKYKIQHISPTLSLLSLLLPPPLSPPPP